MARIWNHLQPASSAQLITRVNILILSCISSWRCKTLLSKYNFRDVLFSFVSLSYYKWKRNSCGDAFPADNKAAHLWTWVVLVLPVVYGRKVLTSNLRRLLAGLTWILQHELSEQWESRAEWWLGGPLWLCYKTTPKRQAWDDIHSRNRSHLLSPQAFQKLDLGFKKEQKRSRNSRV